MAGTPNRISTGRPKDLVKTKLSDMILDRSDLSPSRPFHLAQVINSNDPKKANRLRVRIPVIDDVFYLDDQGNLKDTIGDDKLPWSVHTNGRFVDTPENGTVVLIALIDPQKPHTGRIWLTELNELTSKDIFDKDRLKAELKDVEGWTNAENNLAVKFNNTPGLRDRPKIKSPSGQTNYKVGVRGKGKNKLMFDKDKTTLIQNEGNTNKQSKLELTENVLLMAKELSILSSQSQQKFHPVFDRPLWQYLTLQLSLIQSIITILTSVPAMLGYIPCSPSPASAALNALYQQVNSQLQQLKQKGNGASKYITIN